MPQLPALPAEETASDREIVARIVAGRPAEFAILMRRYNQRVFRSIRSIATSDAEAEDIVQQAYVSAFAKLSQFRGDARFSTWLTRIAINEALQRRRRERPFEVIEGEADPTTPEAEVYRAEVAKLLEVYVDGMPESLRTVFVLRDVEEMSTAQTADCLGLSEEAVRVRLHRGRRLLRERLSGVLEAAPHAFRFDGERCDRIVAAVARQLGFS
ncbi:MAG: RNA polymerase sigma factor [Deltaproteobacteria bacterium]|jgi:RNA polymerase sigma-70 factor (ECF subfamily)